MSLMNIMCTLHLNWEGSLKGLFKFLKFSSGALKTEKI